MTRQKAQDIWQQRILAWKASGKTARSWCQEHGVQLGSFYQWRKRLNPKIVTTDAFIEIEEKKNSAIAIEYHGFRIHLTENFDEDALLRCCITLRNLPCSQ
jgi:hypothetical protein